jgi:dihydroneopterin aldolase/2-amino-4-hydroxy-6-hydroxymethyldihydropteridine diphosphokinase
VKNEFGAEEEMNLDEIRIEDLEVFANHGVFPEENVLGQKFLVSAVLYTDTRRAGRTDDLTASIHYGEVCAFIDRYLREHTFKLLERAAESLAEELLLNTQNLRKVRIEIKKPWAPVGLPLKTVSVSIEREWHDVIIALGSNMGDREGYLNGAVEKLNAVRGCRVKKVSDFIETPPYGVTDQADFLNGCLEMETLMYPHELLDELHRIEKEAGRERIIRWGPRTLDLDIIFYDDMILQDDDLCIPHVEMHKREFVLKPLCGIAPYKRHPVTGKTVKEMLDEVNSGLSAETSG